MSTHKTAAEKSFNQKISSALHEAREFGWSENTSANLKKAFFQYGTYLELVGGDVTVEEVQSWLFEPQTIDSK